MDFSKLIARVKGILLTPKTEWPVIAAEPASVADIYKNYIVVLAAIPVVLGFIKSSIIGFGVPFHGTIRVGIGAGLGAMVVSYVLALIQVYLMALIVDALAPRFGGEKNQIQALKVVAYSFTASWVASIGQIVPWVAWLIMLAGLIYTVYLLYLGLPQTMKCPPQRAVGYTAVSIIIAIVLGWVIALVVAGITGTGAMMTHMGGRTTSGSIDVEFDKDSPLGKLDDWISKVEEASEKREAAQESGDAEAQSAAMGRMMGAVLGGDGEVEALAPDRPRGRSVNMTPPEGFVTDLAKDKALDTEAMLSIKGRLRPAGGPCLRARLRGRPRHLQEPGQHQHPAQYLGAELRRGPDQ